MQTAIGILVHTPIWVLPLLAYLVWQGLRSLRPRTQPLWRMLIVPLVLFLMDLSRRCCLHRCRSTAVPDGLSSMGPKAS